MKNSSNFSIKNSLSVSLFASALLFASCEKEIIQAPSGINAKSNTERASVSVDASQAQQVQFAAASDKVAILPVHKSFDMIVINHLAARSSGPDYCLTVRGDGYVTFEGRRNVSVLGKKVWKLDEEKFSALKRIFKDADFAHIENDLSLMADVPMVYTSYAASASSRQVTLFDYNEGYPANLIFLRLKAEDILDVYEYVAYM